MVSSVELVYGFAESDKSFGYIAVRPPVGYDIIKQLIHDRSHNKQVIIGHVGDTETEITIRHEGPIHEASLSSVVDGLHSILVRNEMQVNVRPELLLVGNEASLFDVENTIPPQDTTHM